MGEKGPFMKKKAISIIAAVSILMNMAACSKTTDSQEAGETSGSEQTLRIVSLSPEITEILFDIGAGDMLVGRSTYCDYPSEVSNVPAVGDLYAMDIEAIAEAQPDMVIASGFMDDSSVSALENLGIEVQILTAGTDVEGMFTLITEVGELVGMQEQAARKADETREALEAVEAPQTDVSVYYVVGYGEYGDYTAGAGTFIDSIITTAGAINAAGDVEGWAIDTEVLIEKDPDVIIINEDMYEDFVGMEPYASLSAVTDGHVVAVDPDLFDRQTPRNVEAIRIIAEAVSSYCNGDADADASQAA